MPVRKSKPKTVPIVCSPVDAGRRLDQFVATRSGNAVFSRKIVKKLILQGSVALNGELCADPDRAMKTGDVVDIMMVHEAKTKMLGQKIPFGVIFEDADILIVNKPSGLVVHPGSGNQTGTLVNALVGTRRKLSDLGGGDRPGIVHRLDRDTSGLLIVAKSNRAHRALSKAFSSREVHKEYAAVVMGRVDRMQGRVEQPVGRDPHIRTQMTAVNPQIPRDAVTHYVVAERFPQSTYLKLHPVTGRTHQIRVHMSYLGHPVLGDPLYGKAETMRLALHAHKITFTHPTTHKTVTFEAPLPDDFKKLLKRERAK